MLNHELVPHQELVPHEDEASELEPWGLMAVDAEGNSRLRKELLPKVLISDPAVQAVKEMAEVASEHPMSAGWLRDARAQGHPEEPHRRNEHRISTHRRGELRRRDHAGDHQFVLQTT